MYTTDSRIVTEVQRRLGQRLSVATVIAVDSVGQASVTPRIVHQGVEIPKTFSGQY